MKSVQRGAPRRLADFLTRRSRPADGADPQPALWRRFVGSATTMAVDAVHASWRGFIDFYNSNDLTHASSIAYYALLSLFPFLLLVASFLGTATASEDDRRAVLVFVFKYFPRQFEFVTRQLDAFRESRLQLGVAGSLLTIWAALGVFGAVTTAVNYAWGVQKYPNYFKHKLVSFVMLAAAGLLMFAALLVLSAHGVARSAWAAAAVERFPALIVFVGLVSRWASTLIFVVVVGLVFYFVPNTRVRFRDVWLGAVFTGVLWKLALLGFSWYVRDLQRFSVHGSIAAVVVFLWWVFICAVIFIYGVEFTAEYARLRAKRYGERYAERLE
jgi:membrane protein